MYNAIKKPNALPKTRIKAGDIVGHLPGIMLPMLNCYGIAGIGAVCHPM
jgi:hypothetical protein